MRAFLGLFAGLLVAFAFTGIASADPTRSIELRADVVDYYSDRFVVTADGHVRAQLSDGTVVSGDTFSMDLKQNRYLIAGGVHLDSVLKRLCGQPPQDLLTRYALGKTGIIVAGGNQRGPTSSRIDKDDAAAKARQVNRGRKACGSTPHDHTIDSRVRSIGRIHRALHRSPFQR